MVTNIGINGFGRIARVVFRIAMEDPEIKVCGINIRNADLDYLVYLVKYDTTFGRYKGSVERYDSGIVVNGIKIPVFSEEDAARIPWDSCQAEYIIESTGAYVTTASSSKHFTKGAKKVIISAPAKDSVTPTFVMGVNHQSYTKDMKVVSNASCTTNCLAPLAKVINDQFGIEEGLMSTIHSATAKQKVVDCRSLKDWRTGRAVFNNIIPSTTGAAKAVALVIPELEGKLTGISYRVPTCDVSVIDVNLRLMTETNYEEICRVLKEASRTYLNGILDYTEDQVVSSDFIGDSHTCIFDAQAGSMMNSKFVKLLAWYDNEWGYSSKLLMMAKHMCQTDIV